MQPLRLLSLSAVLAIATAAITALALQSFASDGDAGLAEAGDLQARLRHAHDRIDTLTQEVEFLQSRLQRSEEASRAALERPMAVGDDGSMAAMRGEIAALKEQVGVDGQLTALFNRAGEDEPEAVAVIRKSLDKIVGERMRDQQRRQLAMFRPFIEQGFKRGLDRAAKKLNLNEDQSKRLKDSSEKAFAKAMPQFTVLFDPSRTAEEKQEAFKEVKTSMNEVTQDASSYMDAEQYQQFNDQQQQAIDGISRFEQMLGGGGMPNFPGMPPLGTPPVVPPTGGATGDPNTPPTVPPAGGTSTL